MREFYRWVIDALAAMGVPIEIYAKPYGMGVTTPFAQDDEHHTYDAVRVRDWWNAIAWSSDVLEEFADGFRRQAKPRSTLLAFVRSRDGALYGKRSDRPPSPNPVEREAYSHDVIAFGFWSGDVNVTEPSYYTYTAPEPATLAQMALRPEGAHWGASGTGHLGLLPYAAVRSCAGSARGAARVLRQRLRGRHESRRMECRSSLECDFVAKDYRSDG